jgi:hypothetical protein
MAKGLSVHPREVLRSREALPMGAVFMSFNPLDEVKGTSLDSVALAQFLVPMLKKIAPNR